MSNPLQAVRGMNDILPAETPSWQYVEETVRRVLESYSYEEIRLPILEYTSLFARSIGDHTDIVEKEMYTFEDRNGDSLTLRPEGTAGCVRAGLEHGLLYNQIRRLWYMGPMFRHERPQKGRYRQFHQIGVEAFGITGPDIDAELLFMIARIWHRLGLTDLKLQINSLGTPESRALFRQRLIDYFSKYKEALDEDSQRRLSTNPLRILDSKNPAMQALIAGAPPLIEHLDRGSAAHFDRLRSLLAAAGVHYEVNPRLVRGLDYYTKTVFEWSTDRLGAQGTVCAGGRYDSLVEQMGGKPTPAVGFAMGVERLVALRDRSENERLTKSPHAYLIAVGDEASGRVLRLAEQLRDTLPGIRLLTHCGGGSFKSQFRRADKSKAKLALVLGPDELAQGAVGVKFLDEDRGQITLPQENLAAYLRQALEERGIFLGHPHPYPPPSQGGGGQ